MQIELSDLPAEIQALLTGGSTRSPVRKPLTDLREPTTAKGRLNRPHFEWSADPDPKGTVIPEYPRLMWNAEGDEQLVESANVPIPPDWTPYPPLVAPVGQMDALQAQLEALSPEDRALVFEAQRQARLKKIQDQLAGLSDRELAKVSGSAAVAAVVDASSGKGRKH